MKALLLAAILAAAGTTVVAAKDRKPPTDVGAAYALLQQKLTSGTAGPGAGVAVDIRQGKEPPVGWYHIDALSCGWYNVHGEMYFYATDGNTTLWDRSQDHILATAMAVSCVQGTQLWYYVFKHGSFDQTESTTYP